MVTQPSELLREQQVTDEYRIPRKTLQTWRWRKVGPPYVKVGGGVRYRRTDVERWLAERTVDPAGLTRLSPEVLR